MRCFEPLTLQPHGKSLRCAFLFALSRIRNNFSECFEIVASNLRDRKGTSANEGNAKAFSTSLFGEIWENC